MTIHSRYSLAGKLGLILLLFVLQFPAAPIGLAGNGPQMVNIGVLAKRGTQITLERWIPTADYLNQQIDDVRFTIKPLSFEEIKPALARHEIDFLLANSGIYVQSEHDFGAFRIATLIMRSGIHPLTRFGGVVFTRDDNQHINTLADLKGHSLAAVDSTSFGGYLVARRELFDLDIDIQEDLQLSFLGTHDAVVHAVLEGRADAGTVRTDTLERMAAAGLADLDRIKVLNPVIDNGFPYRLSTRLYPEWPMAALPHTPNRLVKAVSRALLNLPAEHPAALASQSFGWTVPANYQPVHELFEALNLPPHVPPPPSLRAWLRLHPLASAITLGLLLLILLSVVYLISFNHQLTRSRRHLAAAMRLQEQSAQDLARNLTRLKESEEKFVSLAESALDGIIMLDPQGRIEFWNQSAEKIFGYTSGEALGMPTEEWLQQLKQGNGQARDILRYIGNSDSPMPGTTLELTAQRKRGETFPCEISLSSVLLQGGWHVICVLRDITRRRALEAERHQLETALSQQHKMEALSQLACGIAHEINTPMQTIGNNLAFLRDAFEDTQALLRTHESLLETVRQYAQLAETVAACEKASEELDPEYLNEEVGKAIKQSLEGAEQVQRIVRSMRVFAHPESPQMAPCDLNKLLRDVAALSRHRWSSAAELRFDLDDSLPQIECFPGDLSQALLNLLINAVQAIEEKGGDVPGVIEVSSHLVENEVEISIRDNGNGIPPQAQAHIFNPFFSTRDVGKGSGQGLTLAHEVVAHRHRGSLDFTTEIGKGSVFNLRLPLPVAGGIQTPSLDEARDRIAGLSNS